MKKLTFVLLAMITLSAAAFGGYGDKVYIVFTSIENLKRDGFGAAEETGIVRDALKDQDDSKTRHSYYLVNKGFIVHAGMDGYSFINTRNLIHSIPPVTKPKSFLETIEYIDWDVEAPKLSKTQAERLYKQISECEYVYFIDRRDFSGDSIVIVETIHHNSQIPLSEQPFLRLDF